MQFLILSCNSNDFKIRNWLTGRKSLRCSIQTIVKLKKTNWIRVYASYNIRIFTIFRFQMHINLSTLVFRICRFFTLHHPHKLVYKLVNCTDVFFFFYFIYFFSLFIEVTSINIQVWNSTVRNKLYERNLLFAK